MNKKRLLVGALLLVLFVSACATLLGESKPIFEPSSAALFQSELPQIDPDSERTINAGTLVGFADQYNTYGWLNIPYAAPPTGDLRWRAPRPALAWQGVRAANSYGEPCLQYWGMLAGVPGERGDIVGSEDCLSLNIWAPRTANANNLKPVMVWIHGGGNDSGSAKVYQGHHLAGSQDVVVITINYRLGLIGWLSHEAIRDTSSNPEDASGNYGTLDIIAALRWVKENAASFGGDPNNVTIFGESAGGRNVYSMIASPLAKGLFHRAISQSGSADTTLKVLAEEFADLDNGAPISGLINSSNGLFASIIHTQNPEENSAQIRQRLASTPASELMATLRDMSGAELMTQASKNLGEVDEMRVARVIRDGYVIPESSIYQLLASPSSHNNVPMMLGANRDEQKLFLSRNPEYVDFKFGVLPRIKDVDRYNRVSQYISENWKAGAVDEPAKQISAGGGRPIYAYRFDWDESPNNLLADLPTLIGAAHGLEISFVFGDFKGGVPLDRLVADSNADGRRSLSTTMMDYWGNFAHTGNPGKGRSGAQNDWQPWANTGANIMVLDTPADGGARMSEIRTNVADIKARLPNDDILSSAEDRCEAYAALFLHGYMLSDFWNPQEYQQLGCQAFPALQFRQG